MAPASKSSVREVFFEAPGTDGDVRETSSSIKDSGNNVLSPSLSSCLKLHLFHVKATSLAVGRHSQQAES